MVLLLTPSNKSNNNNNNNNNNGGDEKITAHHDAGAFSSREDDSAALKIRLVIDNQTNAKWKLDCSWLEVGGDLDDLVVPNEIDAKSKVEALVENKERAVKGALVYRRVGDTRDKICLYFLNDENESNEVGFRYFWKTTKKSAKEYYDDVAHGDEGEEHHTTVNGENLQCWFQISHGNEADASWRMTSSIW